MPAPSSDRYPKWSVAPLTIGPSRDVAREVQLADTRPASNEVPQPVVEMSEWSRTTIVTVAVPELSDPSLAWYSKLSVPV